MFDMKVKTEGDETFIESDLNGLKLTSEICKSSLNANVIFDENENAEQYFLDINEIDLVIRHLEKTKEILKKNQH